MCAFSVLCHTFCCVDEHTDRILTKLDLAGITIMIAGSCTPPIYYGFYCDESAKLRNTYLALVWVTNTLALLYIMSPYKFKSHTMQQSVQFLSFFLGGSSVILPVTHMRYFRDPALMYEFQEFPYMLGVFSYMVGGVLFASKFPERYFKGMLCYVGASHQLHHFCVLFGGGIHLWASVREYHKRQLYPCPGHFKLMNIL